MRGYRVLFRFEVEGGARVTRCVFAERRPVVYELFADEIKRLLEAE